MARVKMTTEYEAPYPPNELAHLVAQWSDDGLTFTIRQNTRRRKRHLPTITWGTRIRQLAHLWHNALSQADRDVYIEQASFTDGARPGRKAPPTNGWNQFAMNALAVLKWDPGDTSDFIHADRPYPTDIQLGTVNLETNRVTAQVTFGYAPTPEYPSTLFFYQVHPARVLSFAACRWTAFIDFYSEWDGEKTVYEISIPLHWACPADGSITLLIRHHGPEAGALNWLLTATP